jgi:hypothetical protein
MQPLFLICEFLFRFVAISTAGQLLNMTTRTLCYQRSSPLLSAIADDDMQFDSPASPVDILPVMTTCSHK